MFKNGWSNKMNGDIVKNDVSWWVASGKDINWIGVHRTSLADILKKREWYNMGLLIL